MPTIHTTTSTAEILDGFPPINPELRASVFDCFTILQLYRHLWIWAQTHEYPASSTMNMLYILCDALFYKNFTDEDYPAHYYPWPQLPAPCADYSDCLNRNDQANVDDQRGWARKISMEAKNMHKALKNRVFKYLPVHILNMWNQESIRNPNATIGELLEWLIEEFGDTAEEERNEIKRNLSADWNVTLGIDDLIMRITSAQTFFSMINLELSDQTLIDAANEAIRRTGLFLDEYKGWLKETDRTLANWKEYWGAAVRNAKLANLQLAKHHGHGLNSV